MGRVAELGALGCQNPQITLKSRDNTQMKKLLLLAQRGADSPANKWLKENPLVLGFLALLLGAVLAGSGVYDLRKGVTRDKYGNEIKGGRGKFTSILRVVVGGAVCVFGVYKLIAG